MSGNIFLWKPIADGGRPLVILTPERLNGQIASVQIVGPDGRVIEEGRYQNADGKNANRGHWRYSKPGSSYQNVAVRVVLDDGSAEFYNVGNGANRYENDTPSGTGSATDPPPNVKAGGSSLYPNSPSTIISDGNTSVAVQGFVDFNPEDYFISAEAANQFAQQVGAQNIDQFLDNFNTSQDLTRDNLETEIEGLEFFTPRSSALVRASDTDTNENILGFTDVFDARNEDAVRKATEGNVDVRTGIFDERAPGVRDSANAQVDRSREDQQRIRGRSERRIGEIEREPDFLDPAIKETAVRSARNSAADQTTAGGFGVDSSASRNFLDRIAFDRRIELEQLERDETRKRDDDIRRFESDITVAEDNIRKATGRSADLFNSITAPGILNFTPQQPTPEVTDIGDKIPVPPATDAGSIQRGFTQELTQLSTISPTTAFQGSINEQTYNSGVGLQALAFEQGKFDAIAAGENLLFDKVQEQDRFETAQEAFQEALDIRRNSEQNSSVTTLITSLPALFGSLWESVFGEGSSGGGSGGIGGVGGIGGIGGQGGGGIGNIGGTGQTGGFDVSQGAADIIDWVGSLFRIDPNDNSAEAQTLRVLGDFFQAVFSDGSGNALDGVLNDDSGAIIWNFAGEAGGSGGSGVGSEVTNSAAGGQNAAAAFAIQNTIKELSEIGGNTEETIEGALTAIGTAAGYYFGGEYGAAIGSAIGDILADEVVKPFGSGKNERQIARDQQRDFLTEAGVAYVGDDGSHRIKLVDGTVFDIGKDGGAKLQNHGTNIDGKEERAYYDVDHSHPNAEQTILYTNPLSVILFNGPSGNLFTGHLTNAVMAGDPNDVDRIRQNTIGLAQDAGISYQDGLNRLNNMRNTLAPGLYDAYREGWYRLHFGD